MAKAKNHYARFQRFLNDTSIDDLLATTVGYQQSRNSIDAVNEWVMKNTKSDAEFEEFEDIFNRCLLADETLWFNLSWRIGWAAGAVQGLKKNLEPDIEPSTSCLVGSIYSSLDVT
jgi:hypothetical protein